VLIGVGHVMRCLTLASVLRKRDAQVSFICREQDGHLCNLIEEDGYFVSILSKSEELDSLQDITDRDGMIASFRKDDARKTCDVISALGVKPDWLIVDHYTLDKKWECIVRPMVRHIMVVDDLADNKHDADLLLNQNYTNPLHKRYPDLLPSAATILLGTKYALVRPEFAHSREASLSRRNGQLRRLLVFMGGSDPFNDTSKVLSGLVETTSLVNIVVDVVLGSSNPHQGEIKGICEQLPFVTLHVQTHRMAELMTLADCAINAGGSVTWERCTLGLPALVVIQSHDQVTVSTEINRIGGHKQLGWANKLTGKDYLGAIDALTPDDLNEMSTICATLCDGKGAYRVADQMLNVYRR
jgi:UDP-2,4-diacetamido-2,4,6-trideoxy-beta-L-altropyranose hydrolase